MMAKVKQYEVLYHRKSEAEARGEKAPVHRLIVEASSADAALQAADNKSRLVFKVTKLHKATMPRPDPEPAVNADPYKWGDWDQAMIQAAEAELREDAALDSTPPPSPAPALVPETLYRIDPVTFNAPSTGEVGQLETPSGQVAPSSALSIGASTNDTLDKLITLTDRYSDLTRQMEALNFSLERKDASDHDVLRLLEHLGGRVRDLSYTQAGIQAEIQRIQKVVGYLTTLNPILLTLMLWHSMLHHNPSSIPVKLAIGATLVFSLWCWFKGNRDIAAIERLAGEAGSPRV
jgi:hypothetical protein